LVLDETSEPVEINAQVDVDKVMDSIKSMVEEYNKIVDLVNKELGTKPNRDYAPLTSEQKKELSDDDIKLWEEKAKEGLLFGDSDLRSLSSDLRFVITGGLAEQFREIGISTSTLYSDNGKISIDETKLRAALETNPEKVEQLFTSKAGTDAEGKPTFDGLATNLRNVMDKYVKTIGSMETKGILIKKAGSTSSPMSVTENTIYKQISEIEKMIAKLQDRLESERDRYIKQFTSLETLISQMNSQSGYLSQLGGY
ncbi:MAG: flagellar filament capping protein FliD, partial [Dorea sp.]|nr:flagellar filament capping protein FliD [Dorea sp.]